MLDVRLLWFGVIRLEEMCVVFIVLKMEGMVIGFVFCCKGFFVDF